MNLTITDPMPTPASSNAPTTPRSFFDRIARHTLNDPRDTPFLRLIVLLTVLVLPSAAYLFVPGRFRWYLAVPYLAMLLWFVGPFILMLHNTSHRRLFNRRFAWMNYYIPWVLGPFFGESPETYFAHHVGMHHAEANLPADLSSTMRYDRDSKRAFAHYLGTFLSVGLFDLYKYFVARKRATFARRLIIGELAFYAMVAFAMFIEWRAALIVLVIPVFFTRAAMMAGNWAQHAFIDPTGPESSYKNSITCINTVYNRRCFNDGYHIGHHVKQTRHWTEMPEDFLANQETYVAEGAIVFQGIDFFGIWVLLMLKSYDSLARRFVEIDGAARTPEQIKALLRSRTRAIARV